MYLFNLFAPKSLHVAFFSPKADDDDSLPSSQTRLKKNNFEVKDLFDDEDAYDPFRILSQDENAQDFHSLKQKVSHYFFSYSIELISTSLYKAD